MKHLRISAAQSFTIAPDMRGRMAFAGGVVSPLKASESATVAVPTIPHNMTGILNGVPQADGLWRGLGELAKNVEGKKDTASEQAALALLNLTSRFITLSHLMEATGGITC